MIYTSYFARQRGSTSDSLYAISQYVPCWWPGLKHLPLLAPSKDLLFRYKGGKASEADYEREYISMLNERESEVLALVCGLPDGSVLMCYEKPPKFCHRHLLADWLRARGIEVQEC